ncbi:hypothetical protein J7407_10600, partial [Xanthomonas phaseoli pv. dieffenbachiae]
MEEPNKSALVLLQLEASALLALFDQLRGDAVPRCADAGGLADAVDGHQAHEHAVHVTRETLNN